MWWGTYQTGSFIVQESVPCRTAPVTAPECDTAIAAAPCPIETALRLMGGKWKPVILWYLFTLVTLRFSELKRLVPRATEKMMTQHLRELEADGLVHREVYPQVPPKVEYSLTDSGRSLGPVLVAIREWGLDYNAKSDAAAP